MEHNLNITYYSRRSRTGRCSCGWEKSNGTTREIERAHKLHVRTTCPNGCGPLDAPDGEGRRYCTVGCGFSVR